MTTMAKDNPKPKFNFADSAAAKEISEAMSSLNDAPRPQPQIDAPRQSSRSNGDGWTLVQWRMPDDLYLRMQMYLARNHMRRNTFFNEAVRRFLSDNHA